MPRWRNLLRTLGAVAVVAALVFGFSRPTATAYIRSNGELAGSVTLGCPSPLGKWTGISSDGYRIESQSLNQAPLVAPGSITSQMFVGYVPIKTCQNKTASRQLLVLGVGMLGLVLVGATFISSPGRRQGDESEP